MNDQHAAQRLTASYQRGLAPILRYHNELKLKWHHHSRPVMSFGLLFKEPKQSAEICRAISRLSADIPLETHLGARCLIVSILYNI